MNTWIITGATRGLGRALAERLLDAGYAVAFCARDTEAVRNAEHELSARGPVAGISGSVTDPTLWPRLVDHALALGDLKGLVLNAAVLGDPPTSPVLKLDADNLRHVLEINLLGCLQALKACHVHLTAHPQPRVLALTSDASSGAYPGWAGYGLSKAALELMLLTYAAENPGVGTYVVDPGDMDTRLHRMALPDDTSPLRDPKSVAHALVRLLEAPASASGRWILEPREDGFDPKEVHAHDSQVFD